MDPAWGMGARVVAEQRTWAADAAGRGRPAPRAERVARIHALADDKIRLIAPGDAPMATPLHESVGHRERAAPIRHLRPVRAADGLVEGLDVVDDLRVRQGRRVPAADVLADGGHLRVRRLRRVPAADGLVEGGGGDDENARGVVATCDVSRMPRFSLQAAATKKKVPFVSVVFDASSQPPMASSKAPAPANARGVVATCDVSRMPRFSLQAAAAAKTVELMVGCCGLAAARRLRLQSSS